MNAIDLTRVSLRSLVESLKATNNLPAAPDTTVLRRDALMVEAEALKKRQEEQEESIELSTQAIRELRKSRRRLIRERDQTAAERAVTERAMRDLETSWIVRRPEEDNENEI